MNFDFQQYTELCEWGPTSFLILSDNVFDPLIYYSHLLPILLSLPLAALVLWKNPKIRLQQYFFLTVLLFSIWSIVDLVLWAHADPRIIMFFWSILILLEPLIYASALLFAYTALFKRPLPTYVVGTISMLLVPIIILLPTSLAIESFNLTNCWREVTEGPLVFYGYISQIIIALWIVAFTIVYAVKVEANDLDRTRSIWAALATLCFLAVFSSGNIVGSFYEDWTIGQYGLFGMPIMTAIMSIIITKYKIFNSKLLAAEILVGLLCILTIGIIFIQDLATVRIVSIITFVLVLGIGVALVRSVHREVQQRTEIEALAKKLERANVRLKQLDQMKSEFVSIASHQLRSPLTSIRGYASMLLEGSYGKLPPKAQETMQKIADSSRFMALSVEDYLNVSRIEAGNMKYNNSDFNLKEIAEKVADELRGEAIKKGLLLTFKSDITSRGIVNADVGKIKQVIQNLVDNSMKYTPKGSVNIFVHDNKKKKRIYVDITDTGIGMSEHTLDSIFDKFERAHNANSVNVTGTGLGLYVAKKMTEAMGGSVEAKSEGEGKGSTFTIELPLAM